MGKIKDNVITRGFSGKFGNDLVFRQVDNQTIFAKRTLVASAPTEKQSAVRDKFTEATLFASAAIDNPQAGKEYKLMAELQGLKSAYVAAVTDYLTLPEIGSVFTAAYKGNIGDQFNIKPVVPYKVTEIEASIVLADGSVLEAGKALANGSKFRYTATVANAQAKGSKLVLVARDRQGKESTLALVL
jgi:hypothetical protein